MQKLNAANEHQWNSPSSRAHEKWGQRNLYLCSLLKGSLGRNCLSWQLAGFKNLFCFGECYAWFFSSSIWNQGHPFICYHFLGQIPQPHLLLQTDDGFTGRAIILMLFDGSGRRERWHGILLKDHFKSEGRSELPAGTICLIAMGERTREGQVKSECFVFVTGKVPAAQFLWGKWSPYI